MLSDFIDKHFEHVVSTGWGLWQITRFEALGIAELSLKDKYARVLGHYIGELDRVQALYHRHRNHPDIARDMPDIAGIV